ncbi:MAG: ABC transporter ATP-binding protein [Candidatus Heimdallarchaeota archaeon]|nr:ABC transporter ATP-binding protein [Candidatus Heimdallarchaeota archaeon]
MSQILYDEEKENLPDVGLSMGFLINKLNRESLDKHIRKLKRYFLRTIKVSNFEYKEVNTFIFITSSIPYYKVASKKQREEIEYQIKGFILNYSLKESSRFKAQISKNIEIKDISKILLNLVKSSESPNLEELELEIVRRSEEIKQRAMVHVNNVLLNSFVILWEYPDTKPDLISFPDDFSLKIEKRELVNKEFQLRTLLENLTITQFSKMCVSNLSWIVGSFEHAIDTLTLLFKDESEKERLIQNVNKQLWRSLRVTFGLLSTTQQILSDLLKQVNRINEIKNDLSKQVEELEFDELRNYLIKINLDAECTDYIVWLNQLQQTVKLSYQNLLELINCCHDVPDKKTGDVSKLINSFSWIQSDIQVMKFFSDKFRDVAFFQSIPHEVRYEDETEIEVHDDVILKGIALFKTYRLFGSTVYALRGSDIELKKGEMVAILGPSGSGKTTLLNLLSGLDTPERGGVFILGKNINKLSDREISSFRRKNMGFIFQYYNLIPQLTVLENVMLPALMVGQPQSKVMKRAINLLVEVGIVEYKNQFPIKLSGGQMQRVTIARSMINDPTILFADEPTGDLDSQTGLIVVELIQKFAREKNMGVLFVTHDLQMAKMCDRIIQITDGRVVSN